MTAPSISLGALAGILILVAACESGPPPFTAPRTFLRTGDAPIEVSADTLNAGQKQFNRYCASCHGYEGGGDGPSARSLQHKPRDFRAAQFIYTRAGEGSLPTDAELTATIQNGVVARGMPAWKGMNSDDLEALVSYIKTFSPRWQAGAPSAPVIPPAPVVPPT